MTSATLLLFVFSIVIAFVSATNVNDCKKNKPMLAIQSVQITDCDKPPCQLKKNSTVEIVQKFTPKEDIENLVTSVQADILGLKVPFIGVDGTNACSSISMASNSTVTGCPLKQGVEYIYNNSFPVHRIYPSIEVNVIWALKEKRKTVTCFEVPAKIVSVI